MPSAASTPPAGSPRFDLFGFALALGGTVLFATKGIFIKLAYEYAVPAETLLALRMLVAVPVYLAILATLLMRTPGLSRTLGPRTVLTSMAVGLLGYYVASYLDFAGLVFLSAQMERLVLFTYPFFVLLFGVWLFGQKMVWRLVPAMLVSYGGLAVLFGWNLAVEPEGLWLGTGLVLGSAITFALYQHLARGQIRVIGSGVFTCIAMAAAGLVAIGHNTVVHGVGGYAALPFEVWMLGLGLGLVCTVVPSFMLNAALSRIGAQATASTGVLGPLFTIALAVAILGEPFTVYHAAGTALVIVGTVWFGREDARARRGQASAAALPEEAVPPPAQTRMGIRT